MTEPEATTNSRSQSDLLPNIDSVNELATAQLHSARDRCRLLFHPKLVGMSFKMGFAVVFFAIQIWALANGKPFVGGFFGFVFLIMAVMSVRSLIRAQQQVVAVRNAIDLAIARKGAENA